VLATAEPAAIVVVVDSGVDGGATETSDDECGQRDPDQPAGPAKAVAGAGEPVPEPATRRVGRGWI
jgi:hypothetical protein